MNGNDVERSGPWRDGAWSDVPLTRRGAARCIVASALVAPIAMSAIGAAARAAEPAKVTQASVAYQTSPKNGEKCSACMQFEPPDACKVVRGEIDPNGWCKLFAAKPS